MLASPQLPPVLEWSTAFRARPGESVCGDAYVVARHEHGMLAAAIDGLGHGESAATAAQIAQSVLTAHAGEPVDTLLQRCHRALRETRGAVMTLVSFETQTRRLTALGVGNVEAVLCRADPAAQRQRETVLLRGGIVGYKLPLLRVEAMAVAPGDVMVLIGIGPGCGMPETYQVTSALKYVKDGQRIALVTDGRFSGVSTGACVGHVSPEAWADGPIARVRDGDMIRLVVDTRTLVGSVDVIGLDEATFAARERHPSLRPDPRVPADTKLWAALQNASGGSWGGCVYDADRIAHLLELGRRTETQNG